MQTSYPHITSSIPIIIIGAGGIVTTAHLPAYQMAGFKVRGIYDLDQEKAQTVAKAFHIAEVYTSLEEALVAGGVGVVYDIAVPGNAILSILEQIPEGAAVLLQKPMGEDLEEAKKILACTRERKLKAGVNFQLRYAPAILRLKELIATGNLGEIVDIEINVNVYTPWDLWPFLFSAPRVEILYHSIHYIDLVRVLIGEPQSVMAKTIRHPKMQALSSVKTAMILDHGDLARATILTNHCHHYGPHHQHSYIKVEGSKGAVKIELGVLKNYPTGAKDQFEYVFLDDAGNGEWKEVAIEGSWFPHAFIGSMDQIMRAALGLVPQADNTVEDCIHTMACVEAAYLSSKEGGVIPECL